MRKTKLVIWKHLLKKRYLRLRTIEGEFDCGIALAGHVSTNVAFAKAAVNRAIRKCRQYDKTFLVEELT